MSQDRKCMTLKKCLGNIGAELPSLGYLARMLFIDQIHKTHTE